LLPANLIYGFDTGPHFDLTRSVLAEHRFAEDPLKIVQVENWLTDYYSNSPTIAKSKREQLEKLHFDNLFTNRQVFNYWGWFLANVKTTTQKAAVDNDPFRMLMITGITLHAVQDFYAHSNWTARNPRYADGAYRTGTYLYMAMNTFRVAGGFEDYTGKYPADRKIGPGPGPVPPGALPHGDYNQGLNKDSAVRDHWDEAYVFAYVASHELISLLETWSEEARPGFWKTVREYRIDEKERAKLEYDLRALRNMSMWIEGKGQNGYWKGDKSGSSRFFSAFSGKWVGKNSSRFVKAAATGEIPAELAENLYTDSKAPTLPRIEKFALKKRVIMFRATQIAELKDDNVLTKKLASAGGTDFYSRVMIGGQEYWSRTMQRSREASDPWFEIHFADQSETAVPVKIAVWDEDDTDSGKDQQMDINPAGGKSVLDFIFRITDGRLSGDVNGIFNTPEVPFISEGAKPDGNRARITGFITQALLR
jgi:hypothetical protein